MNKARPASRAESLECPRASSRIEFNIKDNTTDQPAPRDRTRFDPASLLISDDFAWEGVPESRSAKFCGNVPIRGIEVATGRNVAYPVRCETNFHQPCAEAKVRRRLRLLGLLAKGSDTGFFTVVKTSDVGRNILADRRYRRVNKKELGETVWYVSVDRVGGTTFIFASDPLTGRKEPTTFYPTDDLLRLAAEAMSLPGVLGTHTSRMGIGDDDDPSDEVAYLGFAGDVRFRLVERVAAEIALERHGVVVDPLAPTRLDGGVTPEQWIDCMATAWGQVRTRSTGG